MISYSDYKKTHPSLHVMVYIYLVEWLQHIKLAGDGQSGTELEILLTATLAEGTPSLNMQTIILAKTWWMLL